jgi:tetratricopeptide (TPR) repeat protein
VRYPYASAPFYWPFAVEGHVCAQPQPLLGHLPVYDDEIGDRVLNRMIREGVSPDEAVQRYLEMDVVRLSRVERMAEINLDNQRRRDQVTGIDCVDYIIDNYRHEKLFMTRGHPNLGLFKRIAAQVYERLGVPHSLIDAALRSMRTVLFLPDEAPIHPAIAAALGLRFVTPDSRYQFRNEGRFTFEEYVRRYVANTWEPALAEGIKLTYGGESARAVPMLEQALLRCPGSVAGWQTLGLAHSIIGRPDAAQAALDRAAGLDPADPATPRLRAEAWRRAGDGPAAIRAARAAIDLFPWDPASHRALAEALVAAGDLEGGALVARFALSMEPGHLANLLLLGDVLTRLGRLEEAEAVLRSPAAFDPEWGDRRPHLAELLTCAGRLEEAIALTREMIAAAPGLAAHHVRLANLLARREDLDGAAAAFRRAIELAPDFEACHAALADVLARADRVAAALEVTGARIAAGSQDAHLHHRHGHLALRANDPAAAEVAFRRAIELAPSVGWFYLQPTDLLVRSGRAAEAAGLFERFMAAGGHDAGLYHRMGVLLAQTGRRERAADAIRCAIALDATVPAYHAALDAMTAVAA